jgi:hypothetical protein
MSDPKLCPCGGRSICYSTTRTDRYRLQYRKCDQCGLTTKSRRWIDVERRLTANEIEQLPTAAELVSLGPEFEVLLIVRRKS